MKLLLNFKLIKLFIFQHREFYTFNVKQLYNSRFINDTSLSSKCEFSSREKPCQFSPQFSFFLTSDLNRPFLHFKGGDIETNKTFMEQFMSLCSVSKGTGMNIFAAMFLDRVKDFINFKLECPLKQVRLAQISSFNP